MSTQQLRDAVRDAGEEATARAVALLTVAGEAAHENEDAASVVYAAAATSLSRDLPDEVDPLLLGAVVAANDHQPGTCHDVVVDLAASEDPLGVALAREVVLAQYEAADRLAVRVPDDPRDAA